MLPSRVIPFAEPGEKVSPNDVHPQHLVVQIGRDGELLRLRGKILHSAGYTVHSIVPDRATVEVGKARAGRVWVFCHTLELFELALLAVAIRNRCPSDKLLRLTGLNNSQQPQGLPQGLFDELLDSVLGVDELLHAVRRLAQQSAISK